MEIYGGVEAGGTKFVCAVGTGPDDIRAEIRFPTTTPEETLSRTCEFFKQYVEKNGQPLSGIGISSFGPVDLDPQSPHFGKITSTPKPGWAMADILGKIQSETGVPAILDTDVNGAAYGEMIWGAAQGLKDFIYITFGTGVGGGLIINGKPHHGLVHPEMGHMRMPHDFQQDPFNGYCPYHGDCLEGMTSGPAMKARWGQPAETLPDYHPAWDLEAHYIATALQNLICALSPQRIILGGGVMQQPQLFPAIRLKVQQYLNNYVQSPAILEHIDDYIVPPALGGRAGVLGSIALVKYNPFQ